MYRSQRDETKFSSAEKIAWDIVLPYKHLPILNSDRDLAVKIAEKLTKLFTERQLQLATDRIETN